MTPVSEQQLFFLNCDLSSKKHGISVPLQFEFFVGNITQVPAEHSTQWRRMPFNMCSIAFENNENCTAAMYLENQDPVIINKPALLFIPSGVLHKIDDYGPSRKSIWLHFRTIAMHHFDLFSFYHTEPFVYTGDFQNIQQLIQKIISIPNVMDTTYATWLQLYGLSLTLKLLELANINPDSDFSTIIHRYNRLQHALTLLKNSHKKPNLAELAAVSHLSTSRFLTLFTQEMGVSPGKYYNQLRFERSCRILKETQLSLAECADVLGFSDSFHFSREFKKFSGISPNEYRKNSY